MKKMHIVNQPKQKSNTFVIKPKKTRVQLTTCKSATYSYYTKANRKNENKLKYSLKRLDFDNL